MVFVNSVFKEQVDNSNTNITCTEAYILDSSFNPPTVAHKEMLMMSLGRVTDNLHVILSLSVTNVDKASLDMVEVQKRLEWMTDLMFEVSTIYPQHRYSVVLLADARLFFEKTTAIKSLYSNLVNLTFLLGDDTFERLFNKSYYPAFTSNILCEEFKRFFDGNRIFVFTRKFCYDELVKLVDQWISNCIDLSSGSDVVVDVKVIELPEDIRKRSSTQVRQIITDRKEGWQDDLKCLLPPKIYSNLLPSLLLHLSEEDR